MTRAIRLCLIVAALTWPTRGDAQVQPPIRVSPQSGPVAGGTLVTITASGFTAQPAVNIGGTFVRPLIVDANTIIVTTPSHPPGPSQIVVGPDSEAASAPFVFEGVPEDAFEPILLPIASLPVSGRFGSKFQSFLAALNTADGGVIRVYGFGSCKDDFDLLNKPLEIIPSIFAALSEDGCGDPGLTLWVPKEQAQSTQVRAWVAQNFFHGTEIPTVRSADLRTTIALLGIPFSPQFRETLRIYSLEREAMTVNIGWAGGATTSVELRPGRDIFHPAYAELSELPDIDAVGFSPVKADLIIESADPSRRIWAFVSVTNNETQDITVIAPN